MPTKSDSDRGWSKEFPTVNGFYWVRTEQYRELPAEFDGRSISALYGLRLFADDLPRLLPEYLGPISPSDFEQLLRLRKAGRDADEALRLIQGYGFQLDNSAHGQEIRRRAIEAIEALREALAPKGEQS